MSEPNNSQTTVIQPYQPSLLQYSQSLTPQRNFGELFNYTPLSFQEQTNLLQKDLETRQNERQAARATYLSAPSDATNQETPSNARTRQTQTNQRQIDRQQQNKDNQRLLTAYWQRTGDYRTAPEVAIQNQRLYEQTPQLNDYNAVHPLGDPMDYDDPYRRAIGRFTDEEQRIAENMYWHRTGNLNAFSVPMPDFGIEQVRKNPRGEADAFRQTALNSAESILTGATLFGAPSIFNGAKTLLQYATPSAFTRGLSWYLPQYTTALNTIGQFGDAAMYSYFAADTANRLLGENGINKTINLYGNGDFLGGTKSLAGDVLDTTLMLPVLGGPLQEAYNGITRMNNLIAQYRAASAMNRRLSQEITRRMPVDIGYTEISSTPFLTQESRFLPFNQRAVLQIPSTQSPSSSQLLLSLPIPRTSLFRSNPKNSNFPFPLPFEFPVALNRENRNPEVPLSLLFKRDRWQSLQRYLTQGSFSVPTPDYPTPWSHLDVDKILEEQYQITPAMSWDIVDSTRWSDPWAQTKADIAAQNFGFPSLDALKRKLYFDDNISTLTSEYGFKPLFRLGDTKYVMMDPSGRYVTYTVSGRNIKKPKVYENGQYERVYHPDRTIDWSNYTINDVNLLLQRNPQLRDNIRISGNQLYMYGIPVRKVNNTTGKFSEITVGNFIPSQIPLSTFDIANNRLYSGEITVQPDGTVSFPQEYSDILRSNVDQVRNMLGVPNLKLFGSTAAIIGARFPHNTNDIEFLATPEQFQVIQNNPLFKTAKQKSTGTYTLEIPVGNNGKTQEVDINLVDVDPRTGYAVGTRAEELFRQYYPGQYSDSVRERAAGNPFVIPYTPQQLLDNVDPTTKTIMDSFSINPEGNKEKHLLRPFIHIIYSDPIAVQSALHQYGKSLLGENVRFFPMEATQLTDPETNMQALRKLGINLNNSELEVIANDPVRMKNLLDYWFITDRTYNRYVKGTWPEQLGGHGKYFLDPKYFIRSATNWFAPDPRIGLDNGLNWRGWGLNLIIEGDSNFREGTNMLRAQIQPDILYENTDNLGALIDEINFRTGFLGREHLPIVERAFADIGITPRKIYSQSLWMPNQTKVPNSSDRAGLLSGNALMDISDYVESQGLVGQDIHNVLNKLYEHGIFGLVSPQAPGGATPKSNYVSLMYNMNPSTTNIGFTPTTPNLMNISMQSRLRQRFSDIPNIRISIPIQQVENNHSLLQSLDPNKFINF